MKKHFIITLLCCLAAIVSVAQIVKGDMDGNGNVEVSDANEVINTILGKSPIQFIPESEVDNSLVASTWYRTKSSCFTLNSDGTTDYPGAVTFKYIPSSSCILMHNSHDKVVALLNVISLQDGAMIVNILGTGEQMSLTTARPVQLVNSISMSETKLELNVGDSHQLSATVFPEDADNKEISWESSDESVSTVVGGNVIATGEGTAVITCNSTDGSGVKVECQVTVKAVVPEHDYVDLGLPGGVLWATCNLGADKPEDNGKYFAWGDTIGYGDVTTDGKLFDWNHYRYCDNAWNKMNKYCNNNTYGKVDNRVVLLPVDDAATHIKGEGWRMPTRQEMIDLLDERYTATQWDTMNGVNGYRITSLSNGNSIFLPAAGIRNDSRLNYKGDSGRYWSNSVDTYNCNSSYYINLYSGGIAIYSANRFLGFSIRPVKVAEQ